MRKTITEERAPGLEEDEPEPPQSAGDNEDREAADRADEADCTCDGGIVRL